MNFEAIIGLELHIEMNTKSKMFSSAPVSFGDKPNSNVAPIDMAFPGAMPTVNKQAVVNAIRVCNALHMHIDDELWFDRKNYFYSDLAKGYQITQKERPLGKDGCILLSEGKNINIASVHLEEDTCKQLHNTHSTLLDYNRSGIPLLEVVCKPELRNGKEAMEYVEKIRSIVIFLGVSDGKMEKGNIRCDVNVSIRPIGSKKFSNKVEIKNLNTLNNIQRAIDYEIKRQQSLVLSGGQIVQDTRRFDENKKVTVSMRMKSDAIDYKFFIEPNLPPIKLSKDFIEEAINSSSELAEEKMKRYEKLGINDYDAKLLISSKETS
ncbi:MAG: Asp-tRNA(Asn)/Glu-tRNA(Gln) amidotransferase subunit GatB, partial [Bacilli bacterium]|nr:Asp-tRNA(Asn)/Glu-tRNA(Gln) amidotransferase subunit GatB [Bacilli bacterium]